MSSERTFASDLTDDGVLEKELLRIVTSVGASLRRHDLRGRTVTVKIRDADFRTRTASHTLPDAVESDITLFSVGRGLLRELRKKRAMGCRLLGIGVSSLVEGEDPSQTELFGEASASEGERERTLSRVVDDLRERFGDDAVVPGRILEERE